MHRRRERTRNRDQQGWKYLSDGFSWPTLICEDNRGAGAAEKDFCGGSIKRLSTSCWPCVITWKRILATVQQEVLNACLLPLRANWSRPCPDVTQCERRWLLSLTTSPRRSFDFSARHQRRSIEPDRTSTQSKFLDSTSSSGEVNEMNDLF